MREKGGREGKEDGERRERRERGWTNEGEIK